MLLTKGPLHDALRKLALLAPRTSPIPAFTQVLIDAQEDLVTLTATDGRSSASTTLACMNGQLNCALPLRQLAQFVRPANRADRAASVELRAAEDGKVVVADEGSITTLDSLAAGYFPACDTGELNPREHHAWNASEIATALDFVLPVTTADNSRQFATGISVEPQRIVATDGHRLHVARVPGLGLAPVLLHRGALILVRALLSHRGQITVTRDSKAVRFIVGAWVIATKPLEEPFPPVDQVIPPADQGFAVETEASLIVSATRRFPNSRGARPPSIRLVVNGKLEFSTPLGDSTVTVPLTKNGHAGEPLVIGLNQRYIAEALGADSGRVRLTFAGPLDPIVITPSTDRMAVVMPVRL
jgi:DNA polymerase-3 subunit beta